MSYRGQQAVLPAGQGGFNGDSNNQNIPITDLTIARNIRYDGNSWTKAPGLTSYDPAGIAGAPDILDAIQYIPEEGLSRIITACSDGKVYRETAGNLDATTLVSGLDFTDAVVLVEAGEESFSINKKLLLFSKGVAPYYIDGDAATMTPITLVSVDWSGDDQPTGAVYHDSRVVAWLNHNLYFSNLASHVDFITDDPPIISVAPGRGERIVAAFSFLPEKLFVWKYPVGIYEVDTAQITDLFIPVATVKQDIGGSGPKGVCRVKNDIWFISNTGHIHSLTAINASEDTSDSDITAQLNLEAWTRDNVDLSKISTVELSYDEERQEVTAAYTSKDGEINGLALVIDVSDVNNIRAAVEDRGEYFQTLFMYREADGSYQLYVGGTGGKIYQANRIARSIDSTTPYVAMFEYPETDLGYSNPSVAHKQKRFDWLEITAVPTGNYSISFDIFIDGVKTQTVTANLGQSGAALDSFILDTDRLGGGDLVNHKVKLYGRGRRIAIRGTNTGLNENFVITQIMLHYRSAQTDGTS